MKPLDAEISDTGAVTVECGLDAPPEKVWRALTQPALVADWLGALPEGDAQRRDGKTYEIVEASPYTHLRYRWRDDARDGAADTFVTFELSRRDDGGTWFRLVHAPARAPMRGANGNAPPLALAA
jgi:uncharacterized protein YndB with AHSA1/START domain